MTKRNAASSYPRGCTENDLLVHGAERLIAAGKPQAVGLYVMLLIHSMGKGTCYPQDDLLMAELSASRRSIQRWRSAIVEFGLFTVQDRGAKGLYYFLNKDMLPSPATSGGIPESVSEPRHIQRESPATSGARIPPHLAGFNGKKRKEETKEGGGERPRPESAPAASECTAAVSLPPSSVSEVSEYLNQATGKRWTVADVEPHMQRTIQRGSVDDYLRIIAWAVAVWGKKPELLQNVRPQTLFGPKFEEYAEKARQWAHEERFETPGEKRRREEHNEIKRAEREATAVVPAVDLEPKTVAPESPKRPEPVARTPRPMRRAPRQETPEEERARIERKRRVLEAQGEMLRQREANRDAPPVAPVVADDQAAEEEPAAIDPSAAEAPPAAPVEDLPADPAEHGDRPDNDVQRQPEQQQGFDDVRDLEPLRQARSMAELSVLLDERLRRMPAPGKWVAHVEVGLEFSYDPPKPRPTADQVRAQLATDSRFAGFDFEGISDEELLSVTRGDGPLVEASPAWS